MKKQSKGITLIALVITIIILLILAGISIATLTNTGLFGKAKEAKEKSEMADAKEKILLFLDEWHISNTSKEISLKNFLNENIPNDEIDSFETKDNKTYKISKNKYYLLVDSNGNIIEDIQKDEIKPTISNIKITANGSTTEIEDNSLSINTPITINFNSSIDGGTIKSITPAIPYTTDGKEMEIKFTVIGTINGSDHSKTLTISLKDKYKIISGNLIDAVKDGTINIGDYIKYTPDTANTDAILENLNKYSGSTGNTSSTLVQEDLNWRVLDVKDDKVRLISEFPTDSKITLSGYNGYNNAVKLLDDTCSTLYNSSLASNVQNLKIEDIQDKMSETDYSKFYDNFGKSYTTKYKYYPSILLKEKEQKVNGKIGTELNISEQTDLTNQTGKLTAQSLQIKCTAWGTTQEQTVFQDQKYYDLFIGNTKYYPLYWLSSRCIDAYSNNAAYYTNIIENGTISTTPLCFSYYSESSHSYSFRPCITLNSNTIIDTKNSGNGSTIAQAIAIK